MRNALQNLGFIAKNPVESFAEWSSLDENEATEPEDISLYHSWMAEPDEFGDDDLRVTDTRGYSHIL